MDKVTYIGAIAARYEPDKLVKAGFTVIDGRVAPVPVLGEAAGVLECRLKDKFEFGDHDLIVGEILVAYVSEDFKELWQLKDYSPLLYLGQTREVPGWRFITMNGEVKDATYLKVEAVEKRRYTARVVKDAAEKISAELGRPPTLREISGKVDGLAVDRLDVELIAEQLIREGKIKAVKE